MTLIKDDYYHDKCFKCSECNKSLLNQTFKTKNVFL